MKINYILFPLLIALCSCTVSFNNGQAEEAVNVGTEDQQKAVLKAAREVAELFDNGRAAEVWKSVGPILRAQTNEKTFVSTVSALRKPLGAAGKREVLGFNFPSELDGHKGTFGLVAAETDFARAEDFEEKFVFQLEDGQWKLIGYFLSKKVTVGSGHTSNNSSKPTPLRGAA